MILQTALSVATSGTSGWDQAKTLSEIVKAWAEAFGFASAGGFFLYKVFSGYMISNLTLSLVCERRGSGTDGIDFLVVTALAKKGDRGAVTLHDAQATISSPAMNQEALKKLSGITRLGDTTLNGFLHLQQTQSKQDPLLNLPPGDETMFSTFFEILSDQPCTVEVTLLGGWQWHAKTAYQWRASQVSLPLSGK